MKMNMRNPLHRGTRRAFIDGVPLPRCLFADANAGYARCYRVNPSKGNVQLDAAGNPIVDWYTGNVEVRRIEANWRTRAYFVYLWFWSKHYWVRHVLPRPNLWSPA